MSTDLSTDYACKMIAGINESLMTAENLLDELTQCIDDIKPRLPERLIIKLLELQGLVETANGATPNPEEYEHLTSQEG